MKPKEKHDYPIVLTVKEICEILHVGKRVGYELMDRPGFPCIKIGPKLKRVNRDAFFDWIQKEGQRSESKCNHGTES